jgi:hypothetical protein
MTFYKKKNDKNGLDNWILQIIIMYLCTIKLTQDHAKE